MKAFLMQHVLIANRGEIAIRIARAAAEAGYETTAVHAEDDANSLHLRQCDHVVALPGTGPAAYLDIEAVLAAASRSGADAIHPGYGFLSENAAFGQTVTDAGLVFIGPSPEALRVFGDKAEARALAESCQYWQQNRPRCWRKNPPVADDMTRAPIGALVIFGLDAGSAFSLRPALRQAVGFAVHLQDVDVVGQAVEERAGEAFLAEGSGPLVERQVGCNDGGAALIALTD